MKKTMKISVFGVTVAALLLLAGRGTALGQGTIYFYTYNVTPGYGLVYQFGGITLANTNFDAQLYGCTTIGGTYVALGSPETFTMSGGSGTGVVIDGTPAVPGVIAGTTYYYELVVWSLSGPSQTGTSAKESLVLGGGIYPAPDANTFPNFTLSEVPEPATLALVGLGGLSLMLFRRKNS